MKAIETVYKGYRFRSRLEARWAVFFDALGMKWEYEKEGYDLNGLWYLPDFWLPEGGLWIEVKNSLEQVTAEDYQKLARFAEAGQRILLVFSALTLFEPVVQFMDYGRTMMGALAFDSSTKHIYLVPKDVLYLAPRLTGCNSIEKFVIERFNDIFNCEPGYIAAKQARFEHGENGGQRSGLAS